MECVLYVEVDGYDWYFFCEDLFVVLKQFEVFCLISGVVSFGEEVVVFGVFLVGMIVFVVVCYDVEECIWVQVVVILVGVGDLVVFLMY